jgi:predicted nucleic acid-binding protein
VDEFIAEQARELIWNHSYLQSKDAIHAATALNMEIPVLDTFDSDLLKLDRRIGNPPLIIGQPHVPYQPDAFKNG